MRWKKKDTSVPPKDTSVFERTLLFFLYTSCRNPEFEYKNRFSSKLYLSYKLVRNRIFVSVFIGSKMFSHCLNGSCTLTKVILCQNHKKGFIIRTLIIIIIEIFLLDPGRTHFSPWTENDKLCSEVKPWISEVKVIFHTDQILFNSMDISASANKSLIFYFHSLHFDMTWKGKTEVSFQKQKCHLEVQKCPSFFIAMKVFEYFKNANLSVLLKTEVSFDLQKCPFF